jgi:hypothetical protein
MVKVMRYARARERKMPVADDGLGIRGEVA